MKKFIVRLFVLALLLVGLDVSFGMVMDYMYQQAKSGATSKSTYIANKTNEDILIFGSSRAVHHYNPQIIEDSLGMSCYNCGYDGNGILLNYGYYQLIIERYAPKVIVYDVLPAFDLINGDNIKYIKGLRPFYRIGHTRNFVSEVDKIEGVKDYCSMYRYNGISVQTVMDFVKSRIAPKKGYIPSKDKMVKEPVVNDMPDNNMGNIDSIKINYLSDFIDLCQEKGTKLVFVISPLYKRTNSNEYEPLRQLASQKNVVIIDNTLFENRNNDASYFSDAVHLTAEGADEYTRLFTRQLRQILKQD